jgi:hypothetical protein
LFCRITYPIDNILSGTFVYTSIHALPRHSFCIASVGQYSTTIVNIFLQEKLVVFALSQVVYAACIFVGYWAYFLLFTNIRIFDLLPFRFLLVLSFFFVLLGLIDHKLVIYFFTDAKTRTLSGCQL